MFLNYRIYRLEQRIIELQHKHSNIVSLTEDTDEDAQAYLRLLNQNISKKAKKVDILKARRYAKTLRMSMG